MFNEIAFGYVTQ